MLDPKIVPTGFLKRAKHADTLPTAIGEYIQKVSIKHEDLELVGFGSEKRHVSPATPASLYLRAVQFTTLCFTHDDLFPKI